MNKTPTTLIIMDGFGIAPPADDNAVTLAKTPVLDKLFQEYAHTTLSASGLDVGLPAGQMGNSEVGHTNIGGGRVVFQDLPRISRAIEDGSFFKNEAYNQAMDNCLEKGTSLHLCGLLSDGGVHSHIEHLFALLQMAKDKGLTKVYVHCFLDGRDVSPTSGKGFVQALADKCAQLGIGRIATVMGRYYAMDRDKRWERVQMAYDAMVYGEGRRSDDPVAAVAESYANNITDEFMEPVVVDGDGTISDNDSIIFFNYRPDRAREITRAIVDPDFDGFAREFFPTTYVCNTEYDASMPNVLVAWPRIAVKNGLGEYLSRMGMTQLRIAETEKYAHVTFFFNGGVETQYPGEDRVLVPSPKVATYDLQPEMSAFEVCDKCVERIESGAYDVIILNFANCDMVGHTGVLEAAIKAVETVDTCVGKVVDATLKMGGIAMVTADHGNAEDMKQPDGSPMTAHTTNLVPFILCGAGTELRPGRLADIAPTILDVMGLACPEEMDGKTLIVKKSERSAFTRSPEARLRDFLIRRQTHEHICHRLRAVGFPHHLVSGSHRPSCDAVRAAELAPYAVLSGHPAERSADAARLRGADHRPAGRGAGGDGHHLHRLPEPAFSAGRDPHAGPAKQDGGAVHEGPGDGHRRTAQRYRRIAAA